MPLCARRCTPRSPRFPIRKPSPSGSKRRSRTTSPRSTVCRAGHFRVSKNGNVITVTDLIAAACFNDSCRFPPERIRERVIRRFGEAHPFARTLIAWNVERINADDASLPFNAVRFVRATAADSSAPSSFDLDGKAVPTAPLVEAIRGEGLS